MNQYGNYRKKNQADASATTLDLNDEILQLLAEYAINRLNANHAVIMVGGKCIAINEIVDPVFTRHDVSFSSFADFRNRYGNDKIPVKSADGSV